MQVLEDLRKTWHKKERISIKRNERHIQKCKAPSGRQDHRGHEHVWYETWNTTLTRVVLCLNSVDVAPQTLFTRNPDDTSIDDDSEDDESYRPSSERGSSSQAREESVGSWSEESDGSSESSPDELDIIDKPEDPSRQDLEADVTSEGDEETVGLDVAYILQTEEGELGLTSLLEAIENLEGCEEFDDPL
ncbi:hypothetical protein ACEPAH_4113 [Sanghuangporus vaninii]